MGEKVSGAFQDTRGDLVGIEACGIDLQVGCLAIPWFTLRHHRGDSHFRIRLVEQGPLIVP